MSDEPEWDDAPPESPAVVEAFRQMVASFRPAEDEWDYDCSPSWRLAQLGPATERARECGAGD